nr:hypothetical protein L203_06672 [Cryptococcus depauperatus CBS 7841]
MSNTILGSAQATATVSPGLRYVFHTNEQAEDYVSHWETSELLDKLGFEYNARFKVFRCAKCQLKRCSINNENNHCTKFENIVKHTTGRCHRVKHIQAESEILEQIKANHSPHVDENPRIPIFNDRSLLPAVPGLALYDGYYCRICHYGTKGMKVMKAHWRKHDKEHDYATHVIECKLQSFYPYGKNQLYFAVSTPAENSHPNQHSLSSLITAQVSNMPSSSVQQHLGQVSDGREQSPLLMAFSWDTVFQYQKDVRVLHSLVSIPRSHEG